jgi:type I restriction enzyme S subunit
MNGDRLLAHYERIADAPDAIARLRRFILDLAVRGKLVPQDSSDEPASELLKRMAKEKARLDREERTKKQRVNPNGAAAKVVLPSGWALAPLSDLVTVLNGRAYKQNELLEAGTPVLRVGNLFTSDKWYYSDLRLEDDKYCERGDLIFAWSASFGPFIWSGERVIYHYHIWKLHQAGRRRYLRRAAAANPEILDPLGGKAEPACAARSGQSLRGGAVSGFARLAGLGLVPARI